MRPPAPARRRTVPVALLAVALGPLLTAAPASASAPAAPAPAVTARTADKVVLHASSASRGVGDRSAALSSGAVTVVPGVAGPARSVWKVTYTGFTPEAKAAFQRAVDVWAGVVTSPVPITVTATMADLGDPTLLGQTGPGSLYSSPSIGDGESYYPSALADALTRRDLRPDVADIESEFNSRAGGIYYGSGLPGPGQTDFATIVLHELGHGLGFLGSMGVSAASGRGAYETPPDVYDRFTRAADGRSLLSLPDDSRLLGDALQTAVTWGGPVAARRNAGVRPTLFAPASWQPGSSYAHLDEATYARGSADSLMTPFLSAQEVIRDPGAIARGMLADLGWAVVAEPAERSVWSPSAGQFDVAERRADGSVAVRSGTSSGLSRPELLGGLVLGAPAVIRRPSGSLEVYVRGIDDRPYVNRRTASGWTGWSPLDGILSGPPSVSLFSGDEVRLFVRGGDSVLYGRSSPQPDLFAPWENLGGRLAAGTGPAATSPGDRRIEVIVQGTDTKAYRQSFATRWSGFTPLGGVLRDSPAVAAPGGELLTVVRGSDGAPYARTAAVSWTPLTGALLGSPALASAPGSSRADAFVTGTDGELYSNTRTGGTWSGWSPF